MVEDTIKKLTDLSPFIEYLKQTNDDQWTTCVVRTKGGDKNCVMGHLVNWFYGKNYQGVISKAWDIFEEMWATTYMLYAVNDGQNPKYQQLTPKDRVVAYLKNLQGGTEERTWQIMNRHNP